MLPSLGERPLPVSHNMTRSLPSSCITALAALSVLFLASSALAQEQRGSGNFLDNLFSRGEPPAESRQPTQPAPSGRVAQSDPGDLSVRLDRMENALRQLTGTIEQLQYRNQQLEMQLKRMQDDTEYRFQQLGSRGGAAPAQAAPIGPGNVPPPASSPGRRSVRSCAESECARCAANARQSSGDRRSRTSARQWIAGRRSWRARRWRAARFVDACRERPGAAANGRATGGCRVGQRRSRAEIANGSPTAAAPSAQRNSHRSCWCATCDATPVGFAARRIRYGLWLRAS